MELFPFQIDAATEIADKFAAYAQDPLAFTRSKMVPFYQNLNSLTGSGKTLILADAITQIRTHLGVEPIVLWLSKGKVVVWQTLANLSSGKYSELVGGFTVKPLMDCRISDIENSNSGLLLIATVGKFNQADKEQGDRKIFQLALDMADTSLWEMLKKRQDTKGRRRPFIIIYDEGHNLSNQQTQLLLDLNPDALIAASATTRVPAELGRIVDRLRQDKGWKDSDFVTVVRSGDVVRSGLVKQQILLGGYVTPMEIAVNEMLESLRRAELSAENLGLPFKPKAIYVSSTNLVSGGTGDNPSLPFKDRQARPILIWRHLVENCGIEPSSIAVYCNLKFEAKSPPPPGFNLFSGGDADYDNFISGNYQHVIFNLTLQEGWDDPSCYFAYIDKDMGSRDQVTQIVGRVLRQPDAQHYPDPALNTAHFYIRTDERSTFDQVLQEVQSKIAVDSPEITLTVFHGNSGSASKQSLPPRKSKQLPEVSIQSKDAMEPIRKILKSVQDYRTDVSNTIGKGDRIQVLTVIGEPGSETEEWVEVEHSNRVTARWIFVREIQKSYARAINLCDIEDPKFDALVEYRSPAADHIREAAQKVVSAYISNSTVVQNQAAAFDVPSINIDPSKLTKFSNSIHEGYSGLNGFELEFAQALDKSKRLWFRNPSRGCFEVPLLSNGRTHNFNPDFLVWVDRDLVAIDTKGDHLIVEDAGRKLFFLDSVGSNSPEVRIRLITKGTWNDRIEKINRLGFTVWSLKNGKPHPSPTESISETVDLCLK